MKRKGKVPRIGRLRVAGLAVRCVIGVLPAERRRPQRLEVDAVAEVDFAAADSRDPGLGHGLDYRDLAACLEESMVAGRHGLLEELAIAAGDAALRRFPAIRRLDLAVRKAGCIPEAAYAEAALTFRRRALTARSVRP